MHTQPHTRFASSGRILGIAAPLIAAFAAAPAPLPTADVDGNSCTQSAAEARTSCKHAATSEYWLERAKCSNLPTPEERLACRVAALDALHEALQECAEQYDARVELCGELGGGVYAPQIDPASFVPVIDNPYMTLLPGTTFVYETTGGKEVEHDEVTVTDQTKEILGVTCTAVHDVVSVDDEVTEDTIDWFAQDVAGNVWYFGELSESFEDGELSSLGGSWQAGENGALPGIVMEAAPHAGDVYRQEFQIAVAEDAARVLGLAASVVVPYGSFSNCLETEDFSPLEPDSVENKFYAPGVGLLLELDPETGERNELIDIRFK